jgi:hypothetical protein
VAIYSMMDSTQSRVNSSMKSYLFDFAQTLNFYRRYIYLHKLLMTEKSPEKGY